MKIIKYKLSHLLKKIDRALNLLRVNIQTNRNKFTEKKHEDRHYITYQKNKNKISI